MTKKYVTTPIYYVNDTPHIGHAYTTTAADVLARYWRLTGNEVFFLTGTDEHGSKVETAAKQRGLDSKSFCDEVSSSFRRAWENLDINFDRFIRTTEPAHIKCVEIILRKIFDAKQIYKGVYEGLYCTGCEKFLAEAELIDGKCPDHRTAPESYREENYFFKLSAFREKLIKLISDAGEPDHIEISPPARRNEILGKLNLGLEDISISRSKVSWGIPLPFDKSQTIYVWVDALLNYISGSDYAAFSEGEKTEFEKWWPADCHLMAKDILWFHAVIWSSLLLAAGLKPPKKIFAHGFFTLNGQKMSKSLGNIITPSEIVERFGVDAARYLLLTVFPFGVDGDISWEEMVKRYNSELANNLGNLLNRTLTMAEKYFNGIIPSPVEGDGIKLDVFEKLNKFGQNLENLEFHLAAASLQQAIDASNRFIQEKAPWALYAANDVRLKTVIYELIKAIAIISVHLQIFMPRTARTIWKSLGLKEKLEDVSKFCLGGKCDFAISGIQINKIEPLFPRINK